MFLFKLATGECILHTGDFRASPDMEEYPEFWNNSVDILYLDTTYLSSKYGFLSQWESVQLAIIESRRFVEENGMSGSLIVCGAYKIGKEKVWLSIAQARNYKVWIDAERRKALECLNDQSILNVLAECPTKANIHVLSLGNLSYPVNCALITLCVLTAYTMLIHTNLFSLVFRQISKSIQ